MKRITFFMMMAVALAGCQETIVLSEKVETFEAITEGFEGNTKTSIDNQKNIQWSENDQLAIFQGCSIADKYQVTAETAGTGNGTFELIADNSGDVNDDFNSGVEIATNIALYPYADGLSVSNTNVTNGNDVGAYEITGVVLPEIQYYVPDSFGEGTFPMVAVTESMTDHTLRFKNVLGAMKLQLKGTQTIKLIKIEGKNDEKLSGTATVTAYANGLTPAVTMTGTDEASKSVTLDCGDGVELAPSIATDFIIALPPVLFSQGFTVTITYSDDTTNTIETTTANTVLRSSILTMPVVTLTAAGGGSEDNGATYVKAILIDKTSLTMAPGTSYTFVTEIDPMDVTDPTLTWSSSDNTVAVVDQSGKVAAVADGTAKITALAVGGVNATCVVVVKSATANKKYMVGDADYGYGIVIGDVVWAPVNCGYEPATADYKGYPYGKLYQWGRKYGQGYDSNDASYPSGENIVEGPVMPSVGNSDENADIFFIVLESPFDWCKAPNDALWNSGTEDSPIKTETDPCPVGWRVPTYNELDALQTNSLWTTNDSGQQGRYFSGEYTLIESAPQVFFPFAGSLDYDDGNGYTRDAHGNYWSSRSYFDRAHDLSFGDIDMHVYMYPDTRASGYSVRCVQE